METLEKLDFGLKTNIQLGFQCTLMCASILTVFQRGGQFLDTQESEAEENVAAAGSAHSRCAS